MQIGVCRNLLLALWRDQQGTVERSEFHLSQCTDNAKLVAVYGRIPARVHDTVQPAWILDQHRGAILHGGLVDCIGKAGTYFFGPSEEVIEQVDSVRSDVVKRTATCLGRIHQPRSFLAIGWHRAMTSGKSHHGLSYCSLPNQFSSTLYLRL